MSRATVAEAAGVVATHEVALWEVLAYAARQLQPGRQEEVAAHLDGCPLCKARLEEMPAFDEGLAIDELGLAEGQPLEPRHKAVVEAVYRQALRRLRWERLWALAVALPLKVLLLRGALRARMRGQGLVASMLSGAVGALTVATFRYMLRRQR